MIAKITAVDLTPAAVSVDDSATDPPDSMSYRRRSLTVRRAEAFSAILVQTSRDMTKTLRYHKILHRTDIHIRASYFL